MHDPMTVAFDIKYPWYSKRPGDPVWPNGYRETFITIWHVDPETDGSDDSCGWFAPKDVTAKEREVIDDLLREERGDFAYYFVQPTHRHSAKYDYPEVRPGDCIALVVGIFSLFAARLDRRWELTPREIDQAMRLATSPHDNFQSGFAARDEQGRERTVFQLLRNWKRIHRPWYRHPRWHVSHWRIQVQPLQSFLRWAFTRCSVCGGRFAWGESGVGTWDGEGPRWFKSERLTHNNCSGHFAKQPEAPIPA